MSTVPQVGPRAALLLGFLHAGARTESELLRMCQSVATSALFPTVRLAAESIVDEGIDGVRAALERLAELDWVRAIPDPEGGSLWVATRPSHPE